VKLSLRRILWDAFALPWAHRVSLFRATGIPLLAIVACFLIFNSALSEPQSPARWGLYFLYLVAVSWLAIIVHQLVLLDSPVSNSLLERQAALKLSKFVLALAGVWVLRTGAILIIIGGLMGVLLPHYVPAGSPRPELPVSMDSISLLASIMASWLIARISFIFPAIAIGRKADLADAWRESRGNGWRLAIVVGVLPWALDRLTDFLYRNGATTVEYGLLVVVSAVFIVVQVVALSLSYAALTTPAPPPTHPPA
jgi:hypothetical protein